MAKDPSRFSRLARAFIGQHSSYVGNVLFGLQQVSKPRPELPTSALEDLDWDSMLDLAEWVSEQRTEGSESEDRNPLAWTWARQTAADLAENAALFDVPGGGQRLRRSWAVIERLLLDEDPTPERITSTTMDDDTFPINTVRGQAVHAAITVACSLFNDKSRRHGDVLGDVLREVERRSSAEVEPSAAIRSVLAQRFGSLFEINKDLAARLARAMFPLRSQPDATRDRMWRAFLAWNGTSPELFATLREHYSVTVSRVADAEEKVAERTAEHLIWLAAWGVAGAALPDGLIVSFVRSASVPVRHHALEAIGRAIHHEEAPLPAADAQRLVTLWEWWCSEGGAGDLAAFGWWMSSPALEPCWRLAMLPRVLEATGGALDWDHEACDTLAGLVEKSPAQVAACLERLVATDTRNRVYRCAKSIRKVLERLKARGESRAAKAIAARLVARKHEDFKDLM